MQLRDAQVGALRRGYVARRICEQLEQAGGGGRFEPATGVVHASDPVGRTSRLQLGIDGLPEAYSTPLGRLSRFKYSKHELLTELIEPSGRRTQLSYDDERAPTLFSRDGVELARFHWNAAHTESAIEFWDGSRASSSFSPAGKPLRLTNRAGASESFTYDAQNRLVALQDGRGKQIGFSYDEQGRPATTRYPDGRAETSQYDAAGSWSGTQLNGKLVFERQADAANRPLAVTYADGRKDGFAYDELGGVLCVEGPDGALAFAYDDRGNVISETSGDQVFKFEYDASGLLTAIDYAGGLRAQYEYDADKRLTSVGWGAGRVQFSYDLQNREVWSSSSNQLTTRTELAPSQKPTRETTRDERSGAVRFDTVYRYDQQDRLSASNEHDRGTRQYVYDGESQLLGVANGEGHWLETFVYDGAGNRTAASGQSATVDAGNRLLRQGDHCCKYDRRGNLVSLSDGLRTWRFKYDLKNQMTEANGPAGIVLFKYDALGRRIEKKSAERTIRYVWCGEGLAREIITTVAGESVREYVYRPGTYEPVALLADGRFYFYHNDHQGTPQRLTNDQGAVVWAADYYAFGYADVRVGLVDNPLRFAGQYSDVETGLHYNRFRYYSPLLGRYLSVDPLRLLAGNNLYLYAGNNPLNKLDPLGLWSVLGVVGAVIAAAAVVTLAPFVLVAAPLLVAGALIAAEAISVGGDFCWPCFKSGFGEAFGPGLLMGAGFAAGLAVIGAICAPAAAVIGIGVGCYFAYQMLDQYFGWSGGKPFADMTPQEKSKALGHLVGGTAGAVVGGAIVGGVVAAEPGTMPVEDLPGFKEIVDAPPAEEVPFGEAPVEEAPGEVPADEAFADDAPSDEGAEEGAPEPAEEEAAEEEAAEEEEETPEQARQKAVDQRMAELRQEGHGPQRHGPDVTEQQLTDRAVDGKDPMTGTTTDGVTGGTHKYGANATRVNSDEAYVQGDEAMRNSPEFEAARQKAEADGENDFVVKRPLEDIYGEDYKDNVSGVTRGGTKNNPTGTPPGTQPPRATNFEDGTMKGVYRQNPDGTWSTYTMYPEPK